MPNIQNIVDLSDALYPDMPSWPTHPDLKFGSFKRVVRDLSEVSLITQMHMHCGTHVDVPLHSIVGGKSLDQFSMEKFAGQGIVLDFRHKLPTEGITMDDLKNFSKSVQENDVVMLCTNWGKKKGFNSEYMFRWPYLDLSGCDFLVKNKIKAVGTEGLSIGPWSGNVPAQGPVSNCNSLAVHKILLEKEILIIEGLTNLEQVLNNSKDNRAFFVYAPLKFVGSEAGPCRAFAIL